MAPLYLTFTHPFRTQKIHERPPAAAAAAAVRHAAARHAAVRHAACLRRREESNDRCYVSSLTLLMATASGRVATPISSAPARRTLQTTEVPCVEASTSTTMSRARRRPAAALGRDASYHRRSVEENVRENPAILGSVHLDDDVTREAAACGRLRPPLRSALGTVILPSSKRRRERSRESCHPWSVAKRCLANDGEGDLFLVAAARHDAAHHAAPRHAAAFHDAAHHTVDVTRPRHWPVGNEPPALAVNRY